MQIGASKKREKKLKEKKGQEEEEKRLTFDVQIDSLALGLALDVGSSARNVSGHGAADVLQDEALIGDDDVGRHVVRQFDALKERKRDEDDDEREEKDVLLLLLLTSRRHSIRPAGGRASTWQSK